MANKHMKRCSASLIMRGIHIETTTRCHLLPTRMATVKNKTKNSVGKDVENLEPLCTYPNLMIQLN